MISSICLVADLLIGVVGLVGNGEDSGLQDSEEVQVNHDGALQVDERVGAEVLHQPDHVPRNDLLRRASCACE
jgi:hypothetical protein